MSQGKTAPYGSWKSPITSDLIVKESIGLGQVKTDGNDIYWIEMRPSEGGRQAIVRRTTADRNIDVSPREFNARTRVHEYGGGDYVARDAKVYFSNFADQQIYKQSAESAPRIISKDGVDSRVRYADAVVDERRDRIICIREDHRREGRAAVNELVAIPNDGNIEARVLISGRDFYSSPRISPDGSRLAWLAWNHPNMPWDGCELWIGEFENDGAIVDQRLIAGGPRESIFQPEWSPDGGLHFVSDRTGWWNIYRASEPGSVEKICEMEAEFGVPQWIFGLSTYALESADKIVCTFSSRGVYRLCLIDTRTRTLERIDVNYTDIGYLCAAQGRAVFRAGSPNASVAIMEMDLASRETKVLQRANKIQIDPGYISEP